MTNITSNPLPKNQRRFYLKKIDSGCLKATTKGDGQRIKFSSLTDRNKTLTYLAKEFKTSDRLILYWSIITRKLKENVIISEIYAKKPLLSTRNVTDRLHFATE